MSVNPLISILAVNAKTFSTRFSYHPLFFHSGPQLLSTVACPLMTIENYTFVLAFVIRDQSVAILPNLKSKTAGHRAGPAPQLPFANVYVSYSFYSSTR